MICVMLDVPGTGMAFTAVVTPNTYDYSAAALARLLLTLVMVLCTGPTLYLLMLLLLLVLLLLLCIAERLLKSCYYACEVLCLMRLWYKKGSILLRTIWKVKAKDICRIRIKLSWKLKVMIKNVHIRELSLSVKFPEKWNCLEIDIWDQLSDNSWRPRIKKYPTKNIWIILSHKDMVVRYHCLPVRGTQYLTSGLEVEKGKRPDHVWSCVGPHARTKFTSLEPLMV